MIPVLQKRDGDCLVACLASIFECKVLDLPYIRSGSSLRQQIQKWNRFLAKYNIKLISSVQDRYRRSRRFLIGITRSPRDRHANHAVIVHGGKIVHDPSPIQDGYRRKIQFVVLVEPSEQSKPMRSGRISTRQKGYKRGRMLPPTR